MEFTYIRYLIDYSLHVHRISLKDFNQLKELFQKGITSYLMKLVYQLASISISVNITCGTSKEYVDKLSEIKQHDNFLKIFAAIAENYIWSKNELEKIRALSPEFDEFCDILNEL